MNFVEITIPTIQYGNIHIRQEYGDERERKEVVDDLVSMGVELNNCVLNDNNQQKEGEGLMMQRINDKLKVTSNAEIDGVFYRKKEGSWQYWETASSPKRWFELSPSDVTRIGLDGK